MSGEESARERLVTATNRYTLHAATARLLPTTAVGYEEAAWAREDELWVDLVAARNAFLTATVLEAQRTR